VTAAIAASMGTACLCIARTTCVRSRASRTTRWGRSRTSASAATPLTALPQIATSRTPKTPLEPASQTAMWRAPLPCTSTTAPAPSTPSASPATADQTECATLPAPCTTLMDNTSMAASARGTLTACLATAMRPASPAVQPAQMLPSTTTASALTTLNATRNSAQTTYANPLAHSTTSLAHTPSIATVSRIQIASQTSAAR